MARKRLLVMWNEAELVPAAISTVLGTVAAALSELASKISAPPGGACPFKLTLPVAVPPPTTVSGFTLNVDSATALTVSDADFDTPA